MALTAPRVTHCAPQHNRAELPCDTSQLYTCGILSSVRPVRPRSRNDGSPPRDITPPPDSGFNVRTTVHEYGGAEYCLVGDTVYFTNFK